MSEYHLDQLYSRMELQRSLEQEREQMDRDDRRFFIRGAAVVILAIAMLWLAIQMVVSSVLN